MDQYAEDNVENTIEEKTKNKKHIAVIAVVTVLILGSTGLGIAVALQQPEPQAAAVSEASAEEKSSDSPITIILKGEGALTPLEFKIVEADSGALSSSSGLSGFSEVPYELDPSGKTTLGGKEKKLTLPEGEYWLYVAKVPVCEDGSTFVLPNEPIGLRVDGKGETVKVVVALERLEAADMSAEQLEASAQELEAAGYGELAKALRTKASGHSAAEDVGSVDTSGSASSGVADDGQPSGGSSGSDSGSSGSGSGGGETSSGGSGGSTPTPPPVPVPEPDPPAPVQTYHNECSICGNIGQAGNGHLDKHGRGENASISYGIPD